jgi:VanZ family protein
MKQQKISFKKFLPGIAWFFIVAVLTLMPGSDIPKIGWMDNIKNFDKIVHAGLFGGLAFLFSIPYFRSGYSFLQKRIIITRISIAVIVWGITVEFIQKFYIPGRDFELLDWAADSAGVLIAFWICIKIIKHFEEKYV